MNSVIEAGGFGAVVIVVLLAFQSLYETTYKKKQSSKYSLEMIFVATVFSYGGAQWLKGYMQSNKYDIE